jgi:guanylate kinase
LIEILSPVSKGLMQLTGVLTLGLILTISFLDIDVKGAIKVQNVLGEDCLSIFIMPPSIEVLKERLLSRQTESAESIQTRIDKAAYEIEFSSQFKAIVKNEVLEVACAEVAKLIENFIK